MQMNNKELEGLFEMQSLAEKKGLQVRVGTMGSFLQCGIANNMGLGYAVVKRIGGVEFRVDTYGKMNYDFYFDGPYRNWTIRFHSTLEEAKQIVKDFAENPGAPGYPRFYGFIRVYEGEDVFASYNMQRLLLENWALENSIRFEKVFACIGGYAEFQGTPADIYESDNYEGICNTQYSCLSIFNRIRENDVLCVANINRLDGEFLYWKEKFNVITISQKECVEMFKYQQAPKEENNEEAEQPVDTDCPF